MASVVEDRTRDGGTSDARLNAEADATEACRHDGGLRNAGVKAAADATTSSHEARRADATIFDEPWKKSGVSALMDF